MAQKKTAKPAEENLEETKVPEAPQAEGKEPEVSEGKTTEGLAPEEVKKPEEPAEENLEETKVPEAPQAEEKKKKATKVEKPNAVTEKTVQVEELPDYAKRVLALYPDKPMLYVSKSGGVFEPNTSVKMRGNAVLYKNPFYKS